MTDDTYPADRATALAAVRCLAAGDRAGWMVVVRSSEPISLAMAMRLLAVELGTAAFDDLDRALADRIADLLGSEWS